MTQSSPPEDESRSHSRKARNIWLAGSGSAQCKDPTASSVYAKLSMSFDSLNNSNLQSSTTFCSHYWLGLVRPPPGSHDIFLRIRGDGIAGEEGIHPRAPVSQHDPHAVHPNLEKQQVAHVRLAVPLRAQSVGTLHISLRVPPSSRSVTSFHKSAASTVSNTPRDSTK